MTEPQQLISKLVFDALKRGGWKNPPQPLVELIAAVASDCYDIGFKRGLETGADMKQNLSQYVDEILNEVKKV